MNKNKSKAFREVVYMHVQNFVTFNDFWPTTRIFPKDAKTAIQCRVGVPNYTLLFQSKMKWSIIFLTSSRTIRETPIHIYNPRFPKAQAGSPLRDLDPHVITYPFIFYCFFLFVFYDLIISLFITVSFFFFFKKYIF